MSDKPKVVEAMISKVMRRKELTRNQAIDYMLGVATGRLNALWRYDDSVPEGKTTKGIMQSVKPKKRKPKVAKISILPTTDEKPTPKKTAAKSVKSAKKPKPKKSKKRKAAVVEAAQLEIPAA